MTLTDLHKEIRKLLPANMPSNLTVEWWDGVEEGDGLGISLRLWTRKNGRGWWFRSRTPRGLLEEVRVGMSAQKNTLVAVAAELDCELEAHDA